MMNGHDTQTDIEDVNSANTQKVYRQRSARLLGCTAARLYVMYLKIKSWFSGGTETSLEKNPDQSNILEATGVALGHNTIKGWWWTLWVVATTLVLTVSWGLEYWLSFYTSGDRVWFLRLSSLFLVLFGQVQQAAAGIALSSVSLWALASADTGKMTARQVLELADKSWNGFGSGVLALSSAGGSRVSRSWLLLFALGLPGMLLGPVISQVFSPTKRDVWTEGTMEAYASTYDDLLSVDDELLSTLGAMGLVSAQYMNTEPTDGVEEQLDIDWVHVAKAKRRVFYAMPSVEDEVDDNVRTMRISYSCEPASYGASKKFCQDHAAYAQHLRHYEVGGQTGIMQSCHGPTNNVHLRRPLSGTTTSIAVFGSMKSEGKPLQGCICHVNTRIGQVRINSGEVADDGFSPEENYDTGGLVRNLDIGTLLGSVHNRVGQLGLPDEITVNVYGLIFIEVDGVKQLSAVGNGTLSSTVDALNYLTNIVLWSRPSRHEYNTWSKSVVITRAGNPYWFGAMVILLVVWATAGLLAAGVMSSFQWDQGFGAYSCARLMLEVPELFRGHCAGSASLNWKLDTVVGGVGDTQPAAEIGHIGFSDMALVSGRQYAGDMGNRQSSVVGGLQALSSPTLAISM